MNSNCRTVFSETNSRLHPGFPLVVFFFLLTASNLAVGQNADSGELPFSDRMLPALFNKQIQAELELAGEQKDKILELLTELEQKKNEYGRELQEFKNKGATEEELLKKRDEVVALFEVDKSKTFENVDEELLPHQRKRLQQSAIQFSMNAAAKNKKLPTPILVPEVRRFLEIDDGQAERIEKRASELQKELLEKIKKLTDQSRKKLMKELSVEQQKKYRDMVGDRIN